MSDYIEKTIEAYNRVAEQYTKEHATDLGPAIERLEKFTQLVPGKRVLELGFGLGKDARWLMEHDFIYTGIDSNRYYCQKLREAYGGQASIREGDMRRIPIPPLSFDGVWAMASFVHFKLAALASVLNKCYFTLAPAGILFSSMKDAVDNRVEIRVDSTGRTSVLYRPEYFIKIACSEGFELIESVPGKPNPTFPSDDNWTSYFLRKVGKI